MAVWAADRVQVQAGCPPMPTRSEHSRGGWGPAAQCLGPGSWYSCILAAQGQWRCQSCQALLQLTVTTVSGQWRVQAKQSVTLNVFPQCPPSL